MSSTKEPVHPKPFAVVLFQCDDRYSPVPSTWISKCEKFCKWPPTEEKNKAALVRDPISDPDAEWEDFDILSVKYYGKYKANN